MADQPNPPTTAADKPAQSDKPAQADATDDVRARAVADAETMDANTPTPTQEELDRVKSQIAADTKGGAYKNRQARAG